MKYFLIFLIAVLIVQDSVAPPVTKEKDEEEHAKGEPEEGLEESMEYHRYLKEVVQALESDPEFRAKLEKAEEHDILNGKIANELEYVSHHVRSKLDELKRTELERLRHLAIKEYELENGLDPTHMKIPEHLDHANPHTFEIDDLKKLIAKTTKDLDEADKKRKEEFKEYEMHKKFEQEQKMQNMTEEEKKKFENEIHDLEKKHKEHEPLHHPGSKKQLEEVWEKQDHMDQQFDPRTFFFLHDLDGNGVWDQTELKALFLKELDKLYSQGHPEDDLVERAEELERMREHVIKEADLNKDGLISYEEFLNESKKAEFEQDPGWAPLDEQQLYSEEEYESYKRLKAQEIERAIAQGMSQEYHPAGHPQAGYQQFPSHPNQIPQQAQYQHQVPPQQHYPQQGQYVNQMPPQQGQYNQVPPQHGQFNQIPPQQGQFNQMPPHQGQFGNQVPVQQQQQFHPNQQVPVHNNINQVPQQQHYPPQNQQIPVNQNQVPHQQQQQQQQFNQQQFNQQQQPNQQQQQKQLNQQPPNQQQPQFNQQPQQHPNQQPNEQQQQQQNFNQPGQQHQQPAAVNNINQNQQQTQNYQPPANVVPLQNQQVPVAAGQNQQNTQNQVPQQTHEQIASINNAQAHQNDPHVAKT